MESKKQAAPRDVADLQRASTGNRKHAAPCEGCGDVVDNSSNREMTRIRSQLLD